MWWFGTCNQITCSFSCWRTGSLWRIIRTVPWRRTFWLHVSSSMLHKCNISFLNLVWWVKFPPLPGPDELSEFRRVFTSQLVFGVFEHHLWVSLWEHPSSSCFTRGQRVMCSALVLHLYFTLSVLWYGAVGTKWQW